MLTKPDLADKEIVSYLHDAYGLHVQIVTFLPLGADFNTAVYRIATRCGGDYFFKLRRSDFNEASVLVPSYLAGLGLKHVISPLKTLMGQLWTSLGSFNAILYPYIEGSTSVDAPLSDEQWIELGACVKQLHSADIPQMITSSVSGEAFPSRWCKTVKHFLGRIKTQAFEEPVAAKTALFLQSKCDEILGLVKRTQELAAVLQSQPLEYVLCHADLHGWNVLVDRAGDFFVIDWDTLIFAPKERDLMFVGGGISDSGRSVTEEEQLFYQGYGSTHINHDALAYYRYARIIQDIGEYCELIFSFDEDGEDRMQSFEYLQSNFLLGGAIEQAYRADKTRMSL